MVPKIRAFIYIDGFDCLPEAITSVLGIQPTRVWFTGDKIGKSNRARSSNGWVLESPLLEEPNSELYIKWLVDRLPQTLDVLKLVTSKWDAQLSLVFEMVDETPPFNLNPTIISRIGQLGLGIDVDMYLV
jgi:hypothetical protein